MILIRWMSSFLPYGSSKLAASLLVCLTPLSPLFLPALRSVLKGMLKKLDPTHPVGIRPPKGVPCYDFHCDIKAKYPRHMVLVQV